MLKEEKSIRPPLGQTHMWKTHLEDLLPFHPNPIHISTLIAPLVTQFSVHTCFSQIKAAYLPFHPSPVLSLSTSSMFGFHNKRNLTAQFALSSPLSHCPDSVFSPAPSVSFI